jgi:hypothetical protein
MRARAPGSTRRGCDGSGRGQGWGARPHRPAGPRRRSLVLVALLLAIPVLGLANPIDPAWVRGFYDDADTDAVVLQVTSSEGMTWTPLLLLAFFLSITPWIQQPRAGHRWTARMTVPPPRGPPADLDPSRGSHLPLRPSGDSLAPCLSSAPDTSLRFAPASRVSLRRAR